MPNIAIVDAGPLAAAIYTGDRYHAWATRVLRTPRTRWVTCEAALTEAQHILENTSAGIAALRTLSARMELLPLGPDRLAAVWDLALTYAPQMDFADACAVALARELPGAYVLTTDYRDFSTYRVPFASPEGAFYP